MYVKLEGVQENKAIAELTFHAMQERAKVLEGRVEDLTQHGPVKVRARAE